MRNFVNKAFVGYMSGLISSFVLVFVFGLVLQKDISLNDEFKYNLYRLMIWGGVWAILFALPISKKIFIKSTIIGLAVIFFNFIVLMPLSGKGFFAANVGLQVFTMNIVFNYLWALLAGIVYIQVEAKNN